MFVVCSWSDRFDVVVRIRKCVVQIVIFLSRESDHAR